MSRCPVRDPQGTGSGRIVHRVGAVGVVGVVLKTRRKLVGEVHVVGRTFAHVPNGEPIMDQVPGLHPIRGPDGDPAPGHVHDLLVHRKARDRRRDVGGGVRVVGVVVLGDQGAVVGRDRGAIPFRSGGMHGVGVALAGDHRARYLGTEPEDQGLVRPELGRCVPGEVGTGSPIGVGAVTPAWPGGIGATGHIEELHGKLIAHIDVEGLSPAHVGDPELVEDHIPRLDDRIRRKDGGAAPHLQDLLIRYQGRTGTARSGHHLVIRLVALADRIAFIHHNPESMGFPTLERGTGEGNPVRPPYREGGDGLRVDQSAVDVDPEFGGRRALGSEVPHLCREVEGVVAIA